MKKFALVAVVFSMLAGLVGCGSSSGGGCEDYVAKGKECQCGALTDATAKTACETGWDNQLTTLNAVPNADEACAASLATLEASCTAK